MLAILSQQAPAKTEEALRSMGYSPLRLPPHPALPTPVASHPDMLLFFASDAILCTRSYLEIARAPLERIAKATSLPLQAVEEEYGGAYPADVLFNAAPIGKHLFCLPSATAKRITEGGQYSVCPVKQGYTKCSVIPCGENAMVTSDPSIHKAGISSGVNSLLLSPRGIALPGYDHGFLGGCASFAPYRSVDTVLFCGNVDLYPDGEKLKRFLQSNGFYVRSLGELPLTDIGTVFLI